MAGKPAYTVEQVIKAIHEGHTPTGAANRLQCHPDTIRNYAERYATVKHALISERREIVDLAELGLRRAVVNGEAWAIAFALKTLARETYSERTELTGADGGAVTIQLTWGDNAPNA